MHLSLTDGEAFTQMVNLEERKIDSDPTLIILLTEEPRK